MLLQLYMVLLCSMQSPPETVSINNREIPTHDPPTSTRIGLAETTTIVSTVASHLLGELIADLQLQSPSLSQSGHQRHQIITEYLR